MNFSMVLSRSPDGKWGGPTNESKPETEVDLKPEVYSKPEVREVWSGMVGQLLRHEADMSMCDFTFTWSRMKVVDYSIPIMTDATHLTMQRPGLATDW